MAYVILRDPESIRRRLRELFAEQTRGHRRVILGVHLGAQASDFLPDVQGVEVYCTSQPGAVNPYALEELHRRGAKVFFVDRLHMKLCWVKGGGAIVGLANLNLAGDDTGAEAAAGHEMVVYFDDCSVVDIEEIIGSLKVEPLTAENIGELKEKHHLFWKTVEGIGLLPDTAPPEALDFLTWGRGEPDAAEAAAPLAGRAPQTMEWYRHLRSQGQRKLEGLGFPDAGQSNRLAELCFTLEEYLPCSGRDESPHREPGEPPFMDYWSEIMADQATGPSVKRALQEAIQEHGLDKMIIISLVPKDKFLEMLSRKFEQYRRKIN
ncbi:MAG: hypothetical protein FJ128_03435 [Deltaproteobacteria bacterium]|nr:hypothetical protein [Deltaproteobacteria bacterium]